MSILRPFFLLLILHGYFRSAQPAPAADEKGWFGMAVSVDAEGISFNPAIRSITVVTVVASSPAGSAGMFAGDAIVEAEGIIVAGAKASVLKAAMQKKVGDALHLKIRRGTAAPRELTLVAVSKPPGN